MITFEEALELLNKYLSNKNLVKHSIAVSGCMKKIAEYLNDDVNKWRLVGLLHDIDYELTKDEPSRHGLVSLNILKENGFTDDMLYAVKSHSGHSEPISKMDISLYAADPLSGLIVAACLMHPTKRLASLDVNFIMRRFNEKRFAAGADREQIKFCEKMGISLEEFIRISLEGMKEVSDAIGL